MKKHMTMDYRPQTISWRLLGYHAKYIRSWADMLIAKAQGHNYRAKEISKKFWSDFGKYEIEIERYYDHSLACRVTEHITRKPTGIILE